MRHARELYDLSRDAVEIVRDRIEQYSIRCGPIVRGSLTFQTPDDRGGPLLGGLSLNVLYTWRRGTRFTWNPAGFSPTASLAAAIDRALELDTSFTVDLEGAANSAALVAQWLQAEPT